jgi:hypothetical protein
MVARHRFVPFESEPLSAQRWKEDSSEVFKNHVEACG